MKGGECSGTKTSVEKGQVMMSLVLCNAAALGKSFGCSEP